MLHAWVARLGVVILLIALMIVSRLVVALVVALVVVSLIIATVVETGFVWGVVVLVVMRLGIYAVVARMLLANLAAAGMGALVVLSESVDGLLREGGY